MGWREYFPTNFSHFLNHFLASKQILLQKFQYIHFKETEICSKQFIELHTNLVKLREGGRKSDRKLQGKRDDDETETMRSLVRWDWDDEISGANELWVENENEIGNNDVDELWVENENENNANWELGTTNSTAWSSRCVWGWDSISLLRLGLGLNLAAASGVGPLHLWVVLSLSLSPFARLWAPLFAHLSSRSDLKVK